MKAMNINIRGIKCDNPECDYVNEDVSYEDYSQWLNKPCPKCGQNLLTEADYNMTKFIVKMAETANKIFPDIKPGEPITQGTIEFDGTGIPKIKNIETKKYEE